MYKAALLVSFLLSLLFLNCGIGTENIALDLRLLTSEPAAEGIASALLKNNSFLSAVTGISDTLVPSQITSITPKSAKIRFLGIQLSRFTFSNEGVWKEDNDSKLNLSFDREIQLIGKNPDKPLFAESLMVTLNDTGYYNGFTLFYEPELVVSGTISINNSSYEFDELYCPLQNDKSRFITPSPIQVSYDTIQTVSFVIEPSNILNLQGRERSSTSISLTESTPAYFEAKELAIIAPAAGPSISIERYIIHINNVSDYYFSMIVLLNDKGEFSSFGMFPIYTPQYRDTIPLPDGSIQKLDISPVQVPVIVKNESGTYTLFHNNGAVASNPTNRPQLRLREFVRYDHIGTADFISGEKSTSVSYTALKK